MAGLEPIFRREDDIYIPTGHARGPWDDTQQHGGAPGALIAREIEATSPGEDLQVVRLTLEFLSAVPLAPLTVAARVVKPGRRYQLIEAELTAVDGPTIVRARAVRLRRGAVDVPEVAAIPGPESLPVETDPLTAPPGGFLPQSDATQGFHITGMEIRVARGGVHTPGPGTAWMRPARPLVDDEPASPLSRVVMAADFGNGVSASMDFRAGLFINTDLTIHLTRAAADEWVLIDSSTTIDATGVGLATSRLFDRAGRLGTSHQSLLVDAR